MLLGQVERPHVVDDNLQGVLLNDGRVLFNRAVKTLSNGREGRDIAFHTLLDDAVDKACKLVRAGFLGFLFELADDRLLDRIASAEQLTLPVRAVLAFWVAAVPLLELATLCAQRLDLTFRHRLWLCGHGIGSSFRWPILVGRH